MEQEITQQSSLVLSVTRRILRPILRFLLANSVTLPAILETIKQVLVEVAIEDFPVKGKATTDSRISVLTGVHRKDVKRLRAEKSTKWVTPKSVSLGSQIVNQWMTTKKWLGKDKKPLALPKLSAHKGSKSFELLVESVSKDVRSRAVLDELVRSEMVQIIDDNVHLKAEAFVPKANLEDSLYYLERGITSHLNASINNIQGDQPVYFDRMVHYDAIPESCINILTETAGKGAMQYLKRVNQDAKKKNDPSDQHGQSLTVGVYIYHASSKSGEQDD